MTQDELRKECLDHDKYKLERKILPMLENNRTYSEQAKALVEFLVLAVKRARIDGAEELVEFALDEIRDNSMPHFRYIRLHSLQRKVNQMKKEAHNDD